MKRILLPLILMPGAAFAHSGHATSATVLSGIAHPLGGADHLLAMVAVGLWAARFGGRAAWALPGAFVAAMVAGAVAGLTGLPLPGVEPMLLASILLIGLATALALRPSVRVAVPVVALFGLFHGHAHGAEAPAAGQLAYLAGFVLTTAGLHLLGLGLGRRLIAVGRGWLLQGLGGATALAGLGLAFAG
ncbi:HupE/UreJ family protein [Gemmobacter caeruleus]|uniref:HupE/UreJ family protein n=1 Tax=Gemmobacter caeruleus TaxID=2595004 RepID=UPI0011EE9E91|nr:HupE/UreJ family protein [Gemmobacter caeruleus]